MVLGAKNFRAALEGQECLSTARASVLEVPFRKSGAKLSLWTVNRSLAL